MKKVLLSLTFVATSATMFAQSGSLSPYALYGVGALCDQTNSASRSMGGVSQAFREGNQVNFLNPASYSNVDSLSFIFDIGMTLDRTIYKENGNKVTANVGNFEYMMAGFRVAKHVGVAFGLLPVSNIAYNFSSSKPLNEFISYPYSLSQSKVTATTLYDGDGGIREVFLGAGWEPIKGFSLGFNTMFMWGTLDRTLELYYSDSSIKQLYKYWTQDIHTFRFNIGAQYTYDFGKDRSITLGATFTPKTKFGTNAEKLSINYSSATADTTRFVANGGYALPAELAIGLAYRHGTHWRVGVDYLLQKWSSLDNNKYIKVNGTQVEGSTGIFDDRQTIRVGGEWCLNPLSRNYFHRIKVRAGFSYSSSYLNLNTYDAATDAPLASKGPKEISATIGAAFPITNSYNNRSIFNIGFQWVKESGSLIDENTFRINIGLTFNERWFAKWKFE